MSENASPWGDHPMPTADQTLRHDFGPLRLWLRRVENELWLASAHADDQPHPEDGGPPRDADWSRWALRSEAHHLRLLPALPDRMLVVKMEHPFTLLRHAEARIYTRVGPCVRVEVVAAEDHDVARLLEIPTEHYSETWWGGFVEGEPAYWVTTRARRRLTEELFEPHLVMCVLQLANRSGDDLRVEKLALRVEHLSVFEDQGNLWAEETVVEYQGEAEGSDISMNDNAPREAAGAREITPARARTRGFRARTFERLRALSPFGHGG